MLGGFLAALAYKYIFYVPTTKEEMEDEETVGEQSNHQDVEEQPLQGEAV